MDAEWVDPHEGEVAHGEVTDCGGQAPDVMKRQAGKLTSPAQGGRDSTQEAEKDH